MIHYSTASGTNLNFNKSSRTLKPNTRQSMKGSGNGLKSRVCFRKDNNSFIITYSQPSEISSGVYYLNNPILGELVTLIARDEKIKILLSTSVSTKQMNRRLILTVIIPLLISGVIYILFRTDSLIMFKWFANIGLGESIKALRHSIGQLNIPNLIIFSLPDALWIFSFTSFMLIIWRDKFSAQSIPWIFIAPVAGLLYEIGQAFHFVRGTFDTTDLILILIASFLPFVAMIYSRKTVII
jgi:hypothetical protein